MKKPICFLYAYLRNLKFNLGVLNKQQLEVIQISRDVLMTIIDWSIEAAQMNEKARRNGKNKKRKKISFDTIVNMIQTGPLLHNVVN